MPIRQLTPEDQVNAHLQKQLEMREKSIIRTLNFVGVTCVNEARSNGDYLDQTGNLRSSIGYVVLKNGVVVNQSNFAQIKNGSKGKSEGSDFIKSLIADNMKGLVLIVVAGMNYAAYVETNRNVLMSAELLSEKMVPAMLKQLGFKLR